jgi:hypothetical protein
VQSCCWEAFCCLADDLSGYPADLSHLRCPCFARHTLCTLRLRIAPLAKQHQLSCCATWHPVPGDLLPHQAKEIAGYALSLLRPGVDAAVLPADSSTRDFAEFCREVLGVKDSQVCELGAAACSSWDVAATVQKTCALIHS